MIIWLARKHFDGSCIHFMVGIQGLHLHLGLILAIHDTIQCGVMWPQILLHSHMIYVCTGLTSSLSHGFT